MARDAIKRLKRIEAEAAKLRARLGCSDRNEVWRTTDVRRDPKVAVSMLIDCSGSMAGEPIELARKAAACPSEC